jgi:sugar phosphate isomerase/epimerase
MDNKQSADLSNLQMEEAISRFEPEQMALLRRVHVCIPWRMIPQYLAAVLRFQMNIEIGFEANDLDRCSRMDFRSVADQLLASTCAVTLHGPFWDLHPGSSDQLVRQLTSLRIHQFLDLVDIFQPLQVVCHTGYDPRHHGGYRSSWLDRSADFWEPLVKRVEDRHSAILIENVWEYDPEFHAQLIHKMDSPSFGFCLDLGHQNAFSRTPVTEWVQMLGSHLREIHLHDNSGDHDSHLPVGWGKIDFYGLFVLLENRAIRPLLTLEPHQEEHLGPSLKGLGSVLSQCGLV